MIKLITFNYYNIAHSKVAYISLRAPFNNLFAGKIKKAYNLSLCRYHKFV